MGRYRPKEIIYPQEKTEYHIVTPAGVPSRIFETFPMARDYVSKHTLPTGWKLIMVKTVQYEVCHIPQMLEAA